MRNLLGGGEDRLLKIKIVINQKEITLVRDATYLAMKLKQDQDLE